MRHALLVFAICVCTSPLFAQEPVRALTAADYARAEQFLTRNTVPLVTGAAVRPTW
jgi:hypothetical protein